MSLESPREGGSSAEANDGGIFFCSRMGFPRVNEKTWRKPWGKSRKDIIPRAKRGRVREMVGGQEFAF